MLKSLKLLSMIKITWSDIQREKRTKEIRDKMKLVAEWFGLILLACLIAPVLWILMIAILSI